MDRTTLMLTVLQDARDGDYKVIEKPDLTPAQTKITITRFAKISNHKFEVWVEFTAPKGDGFVQGTHTYHTDLDEEFVLDQTYGVHFVPKLH